MDFRQIFLMILMSIVFFASGEIIDVSGDVNGVWEAGNIYQVVESVHVNDGDTLIIEPSAMIKFLDRYSIHVSGIILSEGTLEDSILFTYDLTNPDEDEWEAIHVSNSQASGSKISYCRFEYGFAPVVCHDNANILIENNSFNHGNVGVVVHQASPIIRNNTFNDFCKGVEVEDESSNVQILRNVFTNMLYEGIFCQSFHSCVIEDNSILSSGNNGIYCSGCECVIKNNVVHADWAGIFCRRIDGLVCDNLVIGCHLGIVSTKGVDPHYVNNTIVDCKTGLHMGDDNEAVEITNNIFYDNFTAMHLDLPDFYSFGYNLFWQNNYNQEGDLIAGLGEICSYNHNGTPCDSYYDIFIDPQFYNPEEEYYTLASNSPAIDAGCPDPQYNDPDGTIADMGAYYYPQSFQIPEADFSSDVYFGAPPLAVAFYSESTGDIDEYLWEFGDGSSSTEENPIHVYSATGNYDVCLTVSGSGGISSKNEEEYIMVMPQMEVSGSVQGLWTSDYCWCICGNSEVSAYNTLTIEPGTLVRFMGHYELEVLGTLIAQGTETDSIRFSSGNRYPCQGDWTSLTVRYGSASASSLSHIIIEYADTGILFHYAAATLTASRISSNFCGIELIESNPVINGNLITGNYFYGISVHGNSGGSITNNYFYDGEEDIFLYETNSSFISENLFTRASHRAIHCQGGSPEICCNEFINTPGGVIFLNASPLIHHNLFCGTGEYGVYNFGDGNNPVVYNNTFCNLTYGIKTINSPEFPIFSNLFYGNTHGVYLTEMVEGIEYNLFFANTEDCGYIVPEWFGVLNNCNANNDPCDQNYNIFMCPEFMDPQGYDFSLSADSPCLDAGNPAYIDPDDTVSDIGALYYHHSVNDDNNEIVISPVAMNIYPNPFNPSTTIKYQLSKEGLVNFTVYNIKGQKLEVLLDEYMESGEYTLEWSPRHFSSGIYIIALNLNAHRQQKKVLLLK